MGKKVRIGLREIKALGPGEELWDTSVTGFGARRQRLVSALVVEIG